MDVLESTWIDLIMNVKPGETICLNTDKPFLIEYNSWYTAGYRYWYSEDRSKLLAWLTKNVYEFLEENRDRLCIRRRSMIFKMSAGIRNLAATYYNSDIHGDLCELALKLDNRLFMVQSLRYQ